MKGTKSAYPLMKLVLVVLLGLGVLSLSGLSGTVAEGDYQWTTQASGTNTNLLGVSAADAGHVWASGWVLNGAGTDCLGRGLYYDGSSWSINRDNYNRYSEVSALDPNHVWLVADSSWFPHTFTDSVQFYDGSSWSTEATNDDYFLKGVSAVDANNVWAVGQLRYQASPSDPITFFALFGNYNGTNWDFNTDTDVNELNDVSAADASHVWAVGYDYNNFSNEGFISYYNGVSWARQTSGTDKTLRGVSALDSSHVWAVGDNGTILFYNGSFWSPQTSSTTVNLQGVSALDSSHVWAVGDNGTVLFFNGSSWSTQASGTTEALNDICALDADHVWAVGDNGTILYRGSTEVPGTYSVNASVSGGHGTVSPAGQNVPEGGTATITITPDDGYRIASITDNGAPVAAANPYIITNVTEAHNVVVTFAAEGDYKFYFAEGYTGQDAFAEYLCLMNPGTSTTTAYITYMFSDGTTQAQDVPIAATSRATVNVNGQVGPNRDVSVKITSNTQIVAERPMYFNYSGVWTGGHDVIGATSPQTTHYFAEGYTGAGSFDEWLCLMNPNTSPTTAHITYMFSDGTTQAQDVPIGATSRSTVKVNDQVGADRDVSVQIASDGPIVAERPMYFNYSGQWTGGHDVIGASAPGSSFYFAEGYTGAGFFDEWLCLMNPNPSATTAHITYMFADGTTRKQDVTIGATSRSTVKVNDQVGADRDVSVQITSDDPIVAERPMYFAYQGAWTGGHDVIGAGSPQTIFYFAEGYTGAGSFDEYLCLMNSGANATTAHITYMFSDGTTQNQDVLIGATSRATVNVNGQVGADRDVSVKITSDAPIVAERPMYFNYSGQWTGGHDVVGYTP